MDWKGPSSHQHPHPWLRLRAERALMAHKWPSLLLKTGELTFMVVTTSLTFNRGGKIMMFPPHNGAIKLQIVCVFIHLRDLEGEQMRAWLIWRQGRRLERGKLNSYLTIFKQTIKSYWPKAYWVFSTSEHRLARLFLKWRIVCKDSRIGVVRVHEHVIWHWPSLPCLCNLLWQQLSGVSTTGPWSVSCSVLWDSLSLYRTGSWLVTRGWYTIPAISTGNPQIRGKECSETPG